MFASCAAWHKAPAAPAESIRITISVSRSQTTSTGN